MNPFPLQITDQTQLRPFVLHDAETMFALIQENREHLDYWLRWSGRIKTLADTHQLIELAIEKWANAAGFHAGIWRGETLMGGLVCHFINHESHKSEIGYWLGKQYVGQGLATGAARAALGHLFDVEKLHRVEIQCAVDNVRSRAIPERLGFTLEGIKRESEWLTTRYADHAVYALLDREWTAQKR